MKLFDEAKREAIMKLFNGLKLAAAALLLSVAALRRRVRGSGGSG